MVHLLGGVSSLSKYSVEVPAKAICCAECSKFIIMHEKFLKQYTKIKQYTLRFLLSVSIIYVEYKCMHKNYPL